MESIKIVLGLLNCKTESFIDFGSIFLVSEIMFFEILIDRDRVLPD